jgi:AraC-like DNA-binding protein
MDRTSSTPAELFVPLHAAPRLLPGPPPLSGAGHLEHRTTPTNGSFPACNLVFLLEGEGYLRHRRRAWRLRAPCLFQQRAGAVYSYGPDTAWEELFLCYRPSSLARLVACGMWSHRRRVVELREDTAWLLLARHVISLLRQPDPPAEVLDRSAEALVLLARRIARDAPSGPAPETAGDRWQRCVQRLVADPGRAWDFATLAGELGCSLAHLRRTWRQRQGVSPERWLRRTRLQHARHLLGDPRLAIGIVARRCGFSDPLHFSRLFRQAYGSSPRAYRNG